ncbi:hypothetical protein DDB_G0271900 [Dictyostelium discoideum AX4]|uniref:Uncharacterized protein n=1 Tax=Dictyostelium discoideum TaxID=44689 RepID=Q86I83_DICDI|nr:hypothetical protein DDB_G0271900 [Dictyostelium discoideum AX4]EAL71474.1 hypothetical protein DDB_G0271900 [Dictyostelium discoideum AX4]|eukprot:XP_645401.1 hypothetical protein DDB_G0271900 [Dictyostelium discoideum AX4]
MKILIKRIEILKKRWRMFWKSYFIRQMIVFLQVMILIYLINKAVTKFQMLDNKTTIQEFHNDECKINPTTGKINNSDCLKTGNQFKRVLFFYNDGLARDLSDELISMFKQSSNTFRIQNEGFPASYAVFSSYVTGTPPTNFMGNPILSDNLIYQLTSNGIPMGYFGTRMPAYDVLEEGKYFEKDQVNIEYLKEGSQLYENLFKCAKNSPEKCSQQFLDQKKEKGLSIFFSGDIVDERNHHTGDKYDKTTISIINEWFGNMKYIKQWVDENPEYLLVIFSDHGGKLTSETAAHGANNGGNEAFMVIYNPTIDPLPSNLQDKFIDQVDVCSTIWQHFSGSGVSLPSENIGKISPTTTDPERIYYTYKLNANQLNRFGKRWNYKLRTSDYNQAVETMNKDINHSIELFIHYINSLKIPFLNLKKFPTTEVVMFPITIGLLVASLLSKQYGSFKNLRIQFRLQFAHILIPYLIITGITGLFSGFWVLYWHDNNESIHMFVASLLTTLVMHYAPSAIKIEYNNNNFTLTPNLQSSPLSNSLQPSPLLSSLQQNDNNNINNNNINNNINNNNNNNTNNSGNISDNNNNNINNNNNNNLNENENNQVEIGLNSSTSSTTSSSLSSSTSTIINSISINNLSLLENSNLRNSGNGIDTDLTTPLAFEYKIPNQWIIIYSFYIFFMAVNVFLLTIPLEDLLLVHFYKGSSIIAFIYLMIEFYIQIKRLRAHYAGGEKSNIKPMKEYFYSVYLKFFIYTLVMVAIHYYDKAWRSQKFIHTELAVLVYLVLGVHSIWLLFSPRYYQSDLFLPISMLLYFLSNDKERLYLVLFVIPQFYCISNVFYYKLFNVFQPILKQYRKASSTQYKDEYKINRLCKSIFNYSLKDINFFSGITDHFLPFIVLLMTSIALSCFKLMDMNFQIGDVAIYVPGVYDPPTRPIFSGFVMGFHKLGYFFLLGAFLIKLSNPCPPALVPKYWFSQNTHNSNTNNGGENIGDDQERRRKSGGFIFGYKSKSNADFNRIQESLNSQVWGFLMLLLLCSLFFFHLGYYNFMITKSFVFTVTISVVVLFYGVSLVCSSIGTLFQNLFFRFILKKRNYIHHNLPNIISLDNFTNSNNNNIQYKKINYN